MLLQDLLYNIFKDILYIRLNKADFVIKIMSIVPKVSNLAHGPFVYLSLILFACYGRV